MSAESPDHVDSSHDELKSDSIDLDNVFSQPSRDEWLASALAGLPNHESLESLCKQTLDDLTVQVLYDSYASGQVTSELRSDSTAGAWDNRLCIKNGSDDSSTNKHILEGLNSGNSSLQVHMNSATNLATVLDGVKLVLLPVSLRSTDSYTTAADAYLSIANTQSVDKQLVHCSFNADPVGTWLNGESATQPDQQSLKALAVFSRNISQQLPLAHTILVDAALHHNAGASAQQELVASIATAALYLEALLDEGFSLELASQHIVFQVACDADVLMGIVKLRSLKCLWQHLLSEFATAKNIDFTADSANINIVVETSKRYLSRQDHWNNHLRNIAACTAAAMASAATIIVHPHDNVYGWQASEDPSLGERIARNLPIILDRECGLTKVSDPTAGSFAIETLTQQLMEITWQSLGELNTGDAWITALASGQWQNELNQTHHRRVQRLRDESSVMVGVNRFKEQSLSIDNSIETQDSINPSSALLNAVRDAEEFEQFAIATPETGVKQ
jgi:methylmalonyl-CoA mutase